MDKNYVISIKTILTALLFLLGGYVVYRLSNIFLLLLVSLLVVISIEPLILFICSQSIFNKKISRSYSVIISYSTLVLIFVTIFTIGIPPVLSQLSKMLQTLSQLIGGININGNIENYIRYLFNELSTLSSGLRNITFKIFQQVTALLSLIIISIYISLDWINIKDRFTKLLPKKFQQESKEYFLEVENSIGMWIKGQLFLMVSIGLISFFGLLLIGIDYPLALALISGLLEFIPFVGPLISAILAGIVGFSMSPIKGISVIVLFVIIQQLENNLLVPKVMQKVSGFSPIIILLAILIGSEFFGVLGAIIAVPTMMVGYLFIKSRYKFKL